MDFFVDFSNQPQKVGSYYTLKSEVQLISKLLNETRNTVYCIPGSNERQNNYFSLIMLDDVNPVNVVFVEVTQSVLRDKYPENILNELNDQNYFSTARLRYLYKTFKIHPALNWGVQTNLAADLFASKLNKKFFTFHITEPYESQNSKEYFDSWVTFLIKLRGITNFPFIFVGPLKILKDITSIRDVYFLDALGFSLQQQACIISQSSAFMGTASGMCAPATLSKIPYIIFKHPKYHEVEMSKELYESRLPWATKNQSFKLVPISGKILNSFIQDLVIHETT